MIISKSHDYKASSTGGFVQVLGGETKSGTGNDVEVSTILSKLSQQLLRVARDDRQARGCAENVK